MKKILFLVQIPPPVHGASLRNKFVLESKLINAQFDISCIPLQFSDSVDDLGSVSAKKILILLKFIFTLVRHLMFNRPDLVYFTLAPVGPAFYRDAVISLIIKIFRIPILLHLRGKGIAHTAHGWKKQIYLTVFSNVDVICLSKALTKDIESVFSREPIVVNNGIETSVSLQQFECKREFRKPVRILFLSNLVIEKGILDAISCASALARDGVDYEIEIIGKAVNITEQEIAQILVREKISDRVRIIGPVYGAEKYDHYLDADIFLFPTFYENEAFPGVVLEAMQAGAVVVAYNEGAIPEILDYGNAGVVVESRNIEGLCKAIKELVEDPVKARQLAKNARMKFDSMYTEHAFEIRMLDAFQNIMNKIDRR